MVPQPRLGFCHSTDVAQAVRRCPLSGCSSRSLLPDSAHCPHPPPPLSAFLSRARPFRSSLVPLPTLSCYCSQILFLIFSFHFIALLLARANSFLKLLLLPRSVLFSRTSWDDGYTLFCRVQFDSHMWLMLPKS